MKKPNSVPAARRSSTQLRLNRLEEREVPARLLPDVVGNGGNDRFDVTAGVGNTVTVTLYNRDTGGFVYQWPNIADDVHINAGWGFDQIRVLSAVNRHVSANGEGDRDVAEVHGMNSGWSSRTWDNYTGIHRDQPNTLPAFFSPDIEDTVVYGTAGDDGFRIYDRSTTSALGVYLQGNASPVGDRVELHNVNTATLNYDPVYNWTRADRPGYWSVYVGGDAENGRIYGTTGNDTVDVYSKAPATLFGFFMQSAPPPLLTDYDTVNIWGISNGSVFNGATEVGAGYTVVQPSGAQGYYAGLDIETLWVRGTDFNDWIWTDPAVTRPLFLGGLGGDDQLTGGSGRDVIYGDAGNDTLVGGAGNDGLLGGDGSDTFDGGAGADRMLVQPGENLVNFSQADDAQLVFIPGQTSGRQWTQFEMYEADLAFRRLHQPITLSDGTTVDPGTKLLKTASFGPAIQGPVFLMREEQWAAPSPTVLASATVNSANQGIVRVFGNTPQSPGGFTYTGTLIHEFGHFRDEQHENQFSNLSGWVQYPTNTTNLSQGTDQSGSWWYTTGTPFVTEYARTNRFEDFADSFRVFFTGTTDPGDSPLSIGKRNLLNSFLKSI